MKKLAKRTIASMLLVVIFMAGFGIYLVEFFVSGADWAAFQINRHVYSDGILATGTILDTNGVPLAYIENGERAYNDDFTTRRSTLHVVGDKQGNIGTGLLSSYRTELMGYNIFGGVYSVTGNGNTIHTTIDSKLCNTAYNALRGRNGTVVVYNYKTGDIMCMVSAPGFDPVNPPELNRDESSTQYDGAYINRAITSTFAPGSIFKTVTLAAAIEKLPDLWDMEFECHGQIEIDGDVITCTGSHGIIGIEDAFAKSCNVAFVELALMLDGKTIQSYANKMGLLDGFKMSGIAVAAGSYEIAADGTADLGWSGIGQYNDLVNPLAAARFMGAIANGGVAVNPRIIKNITTPLGFPAGFYGSGASRRQLPQQTADILRDMLRYNVTSYYGESGLSGYNLCAKSGTAEVGENNSPHAWFAGFLDDPDYPYAFAVFVENGGWGLTAAGEIARTVLRQAVES